MTVWDRIYKHYRKTGEPYANIEAPLNPTFLDFVESANLPSKRALDIGSGTGTYLKHLQDKGFEVEGIDSSETAVAIAKKLLGENAKVTLADMYAHQLEANSYGLILSVSAMTHGKKQQVESLVGKIYNALVPGGTVFLTLIATWNREETVGKVEFIGDGEFILQEGPEKGLVHNSFTEEEVKVLFSRFRNVRIQEDPTSGAAKKLIVIAER